VSTAKLVDQRPELGGVVILVAVVHDHRDGTGPGLPTYGALSAASATTYAAISAGFSAAGPGTPDSPTLSPQTPACSGNPSHAEH
jgi:hypothetical protein